MAAPTVPLWRVARPQFAPGLTPEATTDTGTLPDTVWLYRRAIDRPALWAEDTPPLDRARLAAALGCYTLRLHAAGFADGNYRARNLLARNGEYDAMAAENNLFDCFECGCCTYVCPSHIPLVQYFRLSKGILREKKTA